MHHTDIFAPCPIALPLRQLYRNGVKKADSRLHELANASRSSQDAGSRNLGLASLTNPVHASVRPSIGLSTVFVKFKGRISLNSDDFYLRLRRKV